MNREQLRALVLQYFSQLRDGCGDSNCNNPDCASCPNAKVLSKADAFSRSLALAAQKVPLCSDRKIRIDQDSIQGFIKDGKAGVERVGAVFARFESICALFPTLVSTFHTQAGCFFVL